MYAQHKGVAMDAPLAPMIANIFMAHLETTLMDRLLQFGITHYPFLMIFIHSLSLPIKWKTTIYHKPTFTGLLTNPNSYVPSQNKKASMVSMVNRALLICSTYTLLGTEFNEIRRIGLENDYSLSFIDTTIGIKLSQHRNKINRKLNKPIIRCDKKKIYIEIPLIRSFTLELKKKNHTPL
ncbi:unnamed protein product [Rotaria sp. Silwood2]|nr:unnamed protein product [Rotaria sp. Silwood2]CAF3904072.1 unnamed protein product [Rotaria sp. Silwood2]